MTDTTHTPGPWGLMYPDNPFDGFVADSDGTMIAMATGFPARANARLITAAPDLLAALEAILPEMICTVQEVIDNDGSPAWIAEAQAKVAAARRAINKAKGA